MIICGDVLTELKKMPNESIDCSITSPPYWALRDYQLEPVVWDGDEKCEHRWGNKIMPLGSKSGKPGPNAIVGARFAQDEYRRGEGTNFCSLCSAWRGSLGLEPTFELYLKHLLQIFDEIKRVLKKTGTCWVNISDTYFGSSGGRNADGTPGKTEGFNKGNRGTQTGVILPANARRVKSYGTSDKEPVNYQDYDYLCGNLCGACRMAYQIGKFHKESLLSPKQDALSSLPSHEHKEVLNDHSPTSDCSRQDFHTLSANQEITHSANLVGEQSPSFQETKKSSSSSVSLENVSNQNHEAKCLLCGRSLTHDVSLSEHNSAYTNDIEKRLATLDPNKSGIVSLDLAYPYYSKKSSNIQDKSLCCIPDRFKIEMTNRGWVLRNTIIWHKPNCMPSSVKDRFTVDFEYVFFFVKSKKYWFEQQYEPFIINSDMSYRQNLRLGKQYKVKGPYEKNMLLCHKTGHRDWQKGMNERGKDAVMQIHLDRGRNRRCVWTINTKPFKGAHFAVFPEALVEPMICSGCPEFICKKCGKAAERIFKHETSYTLIEPTTEKGIARQEGRGQYRPNSKETGGMPISTKKDLGYTDCGCNAGWDSGVVMDIFCGSGTTGVVAKKLNRQFIGIDLNPKYCEMGQKRIINTQENFI